MDHPPPSPLPLMPNGQCPYGDNTFQKRASLRMSLAIFSSLRKVFYLLIPVESGGDQLVISRIYRMYTLTLPMKIGPNIFKDQLFIGLNTNFIFKVFFHDLKYFLINDNPTTTPAATRMFTTSAEKPNNWFYRLDLVEVNKLNHPSSPRVEDPSYGFISCLRRSVASKVQSC